MKVFILAAMTADGFIGQHSDHLVDWSSKEDKQLFVKLTKGAGVMVMGSSTFKTIGRGLPERKTIVYTSYPKQYEDFEGNIQTTNEDPSQLVNRLKSEGYHSVAICGGTTIYNQFMKAGVVDQLYLVIEPILFGSGVTLLNDIPLTKLELLGQSKLNKHTILLHYAVAK